METAIRQLAHTGITVANMERSLEFWSGGLGFEVLFDVTADGTFAANTTGVPGADIRVTMISGYGHNIELLQYVHPDDRQTFKPRPCDVGSWHVAFMVNDIDAVLATLEAHGFHAVNVPTVIESGPRAGGKAIYAHDPDGTTIELIQPPQPAVAAQPT